VNSHLHMKKKLGLHLLRARLYILKLYLPFKQKILHFKQLFLSFWEIFMSPIFTQTKAKGCFTSLSETGERGFCQPIDFVERLTTTYCLFTHRKDFSLMMVMIMQPKKDFFSHIFLSTTIFQRDSFAIWKYVLSFGAALLCCKESKNVGLSFLYIILIFR